MSATTLGQIRKFIVAAVGVIAMAVNAGFFHGTAEHIATVIIAVAIALGVYVVPNEPAEEVHDESGPTLAP
jgi:hypothetical protein